MVFPLLLVLPVLRATVTCTAPYCVRMRDDVAARMVIGKKFVAPPAMVFFRTTVSTYLSKCLVFPSLAELQATVCPGLPFTRLKSDINRSGDLFYARCVRRFPSAYFEAKLLN